LSETDKATTFFAKTVIKLCLGRVVALSVSDRVLAKLLAMRLLAALSIGLSHLV
jgi:hypothetical protein